MFRKLRKNKTEVEMAEKGVKIVSIKKLESKPEKVYNLHVKDNHNYFAEGINVSNCHLFKAQSLTSIMTKLKDCPYRVGLTGTLDGSKTHKLVIEGLFGKVQKVITTKDLMDKKLLSPLKIKCIVLDHTNKNKEACKDLKYPQEIELIINNKERNEFIRDLTTKTKGNTLVLFQYVEKHGKILYEMIKKKESKRIGKSEKMHAKNKPFMMIKKKKITELKE